MEVPNVSRVLTVVVAVVITGTAAWFGVPRLLAWSDAEYSQQLFAQIASLPESQAAELVRITAQGKNASLPALVATLADPRPAVAQAAEAALLGTVESWRSSTADHSSQIAALATSLHETAPRLAPERLAIPQALAEQLLALPVDSRVVNAADLIANCHSILQLPRPDSAEAQLAGRPPNKDLFENQIDVGVPGVER